MPIAVLSADLAYGMHDIPAPAGYRQAKVLVRYRGTPLCNVDINVVEGRVLAVHLWSLVDLYCGKLLREKVLRDALSLPVRESREVGKLPSCTIIVCTRNRTGDLRRCIESILPQLSQGVEALIIDNNPSDNETEKLVSAYPIQYYRENRPGLNWARARAAKLASTDLLLFTDDDVILDRQWATQMRAPFVDEHVAAVTGAVTPLELEYPSQELYEQYGGFYRGYQTKVFNILTTIPVGAGRAGAGASMAVRRSLALRMALFDSELDCGTQACSGGDFYAFYKLIRAGYTIVYTPEALAWHRHRRTPAELKSMLYGYGVGVYCVLLRCLLRHRDVDSGLLAINWFRQYHLKELLRSLVRRPGAPHLELIWAEIRGILHSPRAYNAVCRREKELGPLSADVGWEGM